MRKVKNSNAHFLAVCGICWCIAVFPWNEEFHPEEAIQEEGPQAEGSLNLREKEVVVSCY